MLRHLLLLLVSCFVFACGQKQEAELLIINATVYNSATGEVAADMLIAISGDTIRAVERTDNAGEYEAGRTIDAKGSVVLPGLWDNHVHFRGGDSLIGDNKRLLPLFLAHGITTVRDAGGDMTPSVLKWQKDIAAGELDGPLIFTSGPKLDGPEPAWAGSIRVSDSTDIAPALDSLQALGADYVKLYDGSLSPEMFYALIAAAEDRGMKVTGHMPMSAYFSRAIEAGLDGTEHMYYLMKACSPAEDSLTELGRGYGIMNAVVKTYDPERADSVFGVMASKEVYVTPTLYIGRTLGGLAYTDHSRDQWLRYMGKGIRKTYQGRVESAKRSGERGRESRERMEQLALQMIPAMQEKGVPILAGSDCGPYNSYVYPGESLHGELGMLEEAGLTLQQTLATSFLNGPAFLGLEEDYGAIKPGYVADIIILEDKSLTSVKSLQNIRTLITNGKIYSRDDLDNLLKDKGE